MKNIINFISALFMLLLVSTAVSAVVDIEFSTAFVGASIGAVALSFVPMPKGVFGVVALRQLWEAELLVSFRAVRNWMSRIPRKDQYVNNNIINITEIGADPDVLINNTSFPISVAQRTDDNVALALNRYDTTNTKVTNAELYALPYDKEGSVIQQHRLTLQEKTTEHGLYLLAVASNTTNTPVINTTGVDNGNGRRRMKSADLITLKQKLDNLKIPQAGRILVLCGDHVADLLLEDQSFQMRYNNTRTGEVIPMYGFEIFEDPYNPVYNDSNVKKAYGSAAAGTDRNASTVFFAPRAFQATGTIEAFLRDKFTDPENRASVVGFGVHHIIAPLKTTGYGAIVSGAI